MSTDAIKQLLASIDSSVDEGLRHLALLSLLYDSACRVQEIINLNVMDFHAAQCCRIYVHGKGNKYRSIPLLGETEKIVSKYIKRFHLMPDSPLFCHKNGKRLTRQGIRYIIRKYSKMANENTPGIIDGSAYPHRLRHSKATHLVDRGVNIYNVRLYINSDFALNLKTAVTKHSKDELVLNSVFSDLEDFYDTIVLPPPPRKPKGKPTVENHVRFLESYLLERLKQNDYTSLDALNQAIQHSGHQPAQLPEKE